MSDCNACIMGSEPDGYCEVWERTEIQKSRKVHKCCECRMEIPAGSKYESTFTVYDGDAQRFATCAICVEIRETYYCNDGAAQALIGELWNDISESGFYEALTEGCIWKLKSAEAMEYLRNRANEYRQARGLPPL